MFKQIYSYASAARLFTLNPMSRDFSNPEGNPSYSPPPPPPPPRTPLPPLPPPSPHLRHHHHNHHCFRHLLLYLFHSFDASHVTRHTSHVTRHTSHVTRHTSPPSSAIALSKWARLRIGSDSATCFISATSNTVYVLKPPLHACFNLALVLFESRYCESLLRKATRVILKVIVIVVT